MYLGLYLFVYISIYLSSLLLILSMWKTLILIFEMIYSIFTLVGVRQKIFSKRR